MTFKKITNLQSYCKATIFGGAGSGKTTLAEELAIGICHNTESSKRVYVIDTEGGMQFYAKKFEDEKVECFISDTQFSTYNEFIQVLREAVRARPDVLIIDNISSIGELVEKQYITDQKQSFFQWGKAKQHYRANVIDVLQNAPFHIIVCAREANKESDSSEIKLKLGLGIDYELNILIHTSIMMEGGEQIRQARIMKDRTGVIDGKIFNNATFNNIAPVLDQLEIIKYSDKFKELKTQLLICTTSEEVKEKGDEIKLAKEKSEISDYEAELLRPFFMQAKNRASQTEQENVKSY